ncbi:uncharacterized protein LOC143695279 isoform X1 [Agelaius phoeniceus]|uniref:uncharacterized protein LOC143695279 isoform X1 n=1 Tax=Agelaius phoeniceus TaxID=39638 RepID=UPI004054D634
MAEPPILGEGVPTSSIAGSQQSSSREQGNPLGARQAPVPNRPTDRIFHPDEPRLPGSSQEPPRSCGVPPPGRASASERARSVRPEEPGLLRRRLSERQQPSDSRNFPAGEAAFLRTRHGPASPDVREISRGLRPTEMMKERCKCITPVAEGYG